MQKNKLPQSPAEFQLQNGKTLLWNLNQPANILTRTTSFYDGIVMIKPSDGNIPSEFMDTVVQVYPV